MLTKRYVLKLHVLQCCARTASPYGSHEDQRSQGVVGQQQVDADA